MQPTDQILIPRWLIPMHDAPTRVLENHAIAITEGKITAIAPLPKIQSRYRAAQEIPLPNHALLPGLINAHTHAAMTLLRGYADDLPLMQWLTEYIWPAEGKWVDEKFIQIGTDLALLEMLQSGTTCFNDMYFFPDITAECTTRANMRACVGMIMIDAPTVWAQTPDEYITKGTDLHDAYRHSPLITTAFAPHAPYTVGDSSLEKIRILADEMDCRIHMHVHETKTEVEESVANLGMRPLQRLQKLDLLSPRLTAVHMTQLLPDEISQIQERAVKVVHCPQSNLKLASGFCPVARLAENKIDLAIGTDGAASNNDLDMLSEMQTAALLAKCYGDDPAALPAAAALQAATIGGARALGLEEQIGSLAPGKQADLIALDLSAPATQPLYHPLSQIVYSASREQVTDVWVAGKRLLENRTPTTLDREAILARARELSATIQASQTKPKS